MKRKIPAVLVIFGLLYGGCAVPESQGPTPDGAHSRHEPPTLESIQDAMGPIPKVPGLLRDLAIREMLLKYVIKNHVSEQIKIWFISFGNKTDPPAGFLQRFADMPIPVKNVSDVAIHPRTRVRDAKTGLEGAIATARIIRWLDPMTAEVEHAYYVHGVWAGGATMIIRYEDGKWTLVETSREWIS